MVFDRRWYGGLIWLSLSLGVCSCGQSGKRAYSDCTPTAEESLSTHSKSSQLNQLLDGAIADGLPGVIMLVDDPSGTWVAARGLADLDDSSHTLKTCHSLPIASITKTLVATAIMRLVDSGRASLDQTLSTLLPAAELKDIPSTDQITLRQLLSHTSGIRHYPESVSYVTGILNRFEHVPTANEKLDYIRGKDLYAPPGQAYHYSNSNYILAGKVIEQLTNTSLENYLKTAFFAPLDMGRTVFETNARIGSTIPNGYMDLYGDSTAYLFYYGDGGASAAGGTTSPIHDLLLFSHALLRDHSLVLPASLTTMMTPVIATDPAAYGYEQEGLGLHSWKTAGGPAWGHTGEEINYRAWWHWWPSSQTTWIMLLNSNYGQFKIKADRLRDQVIRVLFPG